MALRRVSIIMTACLLPVSAAIACPTKDDLPRTIVLVQNAPTFVRTDYETAGADLFFRTEMRIGPSVIVESGYLAHPFAPVETALNGAVETVTYSGDPAVFDHLDQIGHHRIEGTKTLPSGATQPHFVEARFAGTGRVELAECQYDVWHVDLVQPGGPNGDIAARVDFAPALGLILGITLTSAANQQPLVHYQWIGTGDDVAR
ncbi:MAG: hypothetical protein ACRBCL_03255 [Maritimibacter sp.]